MDFTFTAEDCIGMRKAVQKFYLGITDLRDSVLPNVVDAEKPWEDVIADFQMLMYCYLLMEANREVERAAEIEVNGRKVVRGYAKQVLQFYRSDYARIKAYMPMNNMSFISQYADVDEAISERMQQIVTKTYYPMLNNSLKQSPNLDSHVAQAVAHVVNGLCLAVMACERGMRDNHHVPSRLLSGFGERICRLAAAITLVNDCGVVYDQEYIEKVITDCSNVTINTMQAALNDIHRHAMEIDLEPYVSAADYTKEHFMHLIKTKGFDISADAKRIERNRNH